MGPINNAISFLIQSVFDIYLMVLMLRFIFQYLRVDFYNPISQMIVKVTSPVVVPLRKWIPGYWGLDLATLVVLFLVCILKLFLIGLIEKHIFANVLGLFIWACGDLTGLLFKLFFYSVLANIVISWISPRTHSPVTVVLQQLTEPLLAPARKYIPPMGGIDISPIPVLIILQILIMVISDPLAFTGMILALK